MKRACAAAVALLCCVSPAAADESDPLLRAIDAAIERRREELERTRLRVAVELRSTIAALSSQDVADYLAGRRSVPVLDAWLWLPAPPPVRFSEPEPRIITAAATPTTLGPAQQDGLDASAWAQTDRTYEPIKVVPEVLHGADDHTRSAWTVDDPEAQERRFLEQRATCAIIDGGDWLRRNMDGRVPLPPIRDATGHTRSRYVRATLPTPEEIDDVFRRWGEVTRARLARHAPRGPSPSPSAGDTLLAALHGGRPGRR